MLTIQDMITYNQCIDIANAIQHTGLLGYRCKIISEAWSSPTGSQNTVYEVRIHAIEPIVDNKKINFCIEKDFTLFNTYLTLLELHDILSDFLLQEIIK